MNDRIEIRMLGQFFVRRSDGEVVAADEWNTGKTTDLLRLLALNANRPVSVSGLLEKLWPDVEEVKARASLRTAASRVRRALGTAQIDRQLGRLVLRDVWVDVVAFQTIVHEAKAAMHARDYARVVSLAREAEALYIADFRAHDDKSVWATEVRESLMMSRQTLLADAGVSAVKLLWMRDAIDFSTLAITADPCFERPHRSLMRAHAGLGEVELALRAFEHCRANLSQELGADPSSQTRALHIQILSGNIEEFPVTPFTGREREVESLAAAIAAGIASNGCDVVCLTGPEGSGREALLQAAVAQVPRARIRQPLNDGLNTTAVKLPNVVSDRRSDVSVLGPIDGEPAREANRMMVFLSGLVPGVPRVISVLTSESAGDLLEDHLRDGPINLHRRSTSKISDQDLAALAYAVLSGTATPTLLKELKEQSEGLAGYAVSILREWIASGWVISTANGLALYNDAGAVTGMPPVGNHFRMLLEQVNHQELEFCQLLAIIDSPVSASAILALNSDDVGNSEKLDEIQFLLDEMADLGILRISAQGYEFRNFAIRDSFVSWLRPAVKARLMHKIGLKFRTNIGVTPNEATEA